MNYGLTRINNPYVHEHWYNHKITKLRTLPSRSYMHYYKRNFYTHDVLGIEHTFLIRHVTGEYFPFKSWYMSYNGWLVIMLHWFKPNKIKTKLNPMLDHNYLLAKNNFNKQTRANYDKRLLLSYTYSKRSHNLIKYSF